MALFALVLFGLNTAVAFTQPLGMHASIQQDGHVLDLLGKRQKLMSDVRELDKHLWQRSPVPRDQHALIFAEEKYEEIINVRDKKYVVRDFTKGMLPPSVWWNFRRKMSSIFGQPGPIDIGRYNEMRGNMYSALMESKPVCDEGSAAWGGLRNIHIGLDIGAAVGTPVRSFADGKVYCFGYNAGAGDYGHTLVMEHEFRGVKVWALYGHLSGRSMERKFVGQPATRGQIIAYLGAPHENGGWPSHVHFQLSLVPPPAHDMPGVVSTEDLPRALDLFPDPLLVLGPLYESDGSTFGLQEV